MRYVRLIAAAAAFVLAVGVIPVAAGPQQSSDGQGRLIAQTDQTAPKAAFSTTVVGQVTKVDHKSGKITLDTPEGPVNVKFAPSIVQNIQTGDRVTVGFGLVAEGTPAASPSTSPGGSDKSGSDKK